MLRPLREYKSYECMSVKDFVECCEFGGYTDDDGYGYPILGDFVDDKVVIYPSRRRMIPTEATGIVWFNR